MCHQLENTPIDLEKDSLYRSYTLIKIILLMEMSPMTGEIYLHQITKSNIIIPVIGDISITSIKLDQCQKPKTSFNFDGLPGLKESKLQEIISQILDLFFTLFMNTISMS